MHPEIQAINVPIYKTNMTGNKAQGYFHVGIPLKYALPEGKYVVYVFMEGKVIGPVKFEINGKVTGATKDKVEAKETFFDYVLGRLSGRS